MHRAIVGLVGSLVLIVSLSGRAAAQEENSVLDGLSPTVSNPFFPLKPGMSRRYGGQEVNPELGKRLISACGSVSPRCLMKSRERP